MKRGSPPAAGASVGSFYLGAYDPAGIQPGGNLTVLGMSAEQSGGRLRGAFRLLLPQSGAALAAAPLSVLAAGAALNPNGNLLPHHADQARCCTLTLHPKQPFWMLPPAERARVCSAERTAALRFPATDLASLLTQQTLRRATSLGWT